MEITDEAKTVMPVWLDMIAVGTGPIVLKGCTKILPLLHYRVQIYAKGGGISREGRILVLQLSSQPRQC